MTTATAAWTDELRDALGPDGVLTDPNPGKVFRRAAVGDLAAVAGLAGR